MSSTDDLRDIILDVADEETLTERQEEEPSRDPIEGEDAETEAEVSEFAGQDGLGDAVDGDEGGGYDGATA